MDYKGVAKPPFFEMVFKAPSGVTTDLTATIIFGDVIQPTNTFTISRVGELSPEG